MQHLDLALEQADRAGRALPLAAGVRRLHALGLQVLEQRAAGLPVVEGVRLAVELHLEAHRRLRTVGHLDGRVGLRLGLGDLLGGRSNLGHVTERVAAERHELLLVATLAGELQLAQRGDDHLHEGRRAADEGVPGGVRRRERLQLLAGRQALHGLQPVHDLQPVGVLGGQSAQLVGEDHRALVAVGVEHHDPAGAVRERGAGDRHDRGDAAAAGEEQQVGVERGRGEDAAGRQHPHGRADLEVVADPVGGVAVDGALDRDGQRAAVVRARGQRVAAGREAVAVTRHRQGQELARLVLEGGLGALGHPEGDGARVGRLVDDLHDLQHI